MKQYTLTFPSVYEKRVERRSTSTLSSNCNIPVNRDGNAKIIEPLSFVGYFDSLSYFLTNNESTFQRFSSSCSCSLLERSYQRVYQSFENQSSFVFAQLSARGDRRSRRANPRVAFRLSSGRVEFIGFNRTERAPPCYTLSLPGRNVVAKCCCYSPGRTE